MNNKHLIKKINFNNYLISYNDILKKIEKNIEVELNLYKKIYERNLIYFLLLQYLLPIIHIGLFMFQHT